ncbi:hypothetical protein [Nannocystis pusilla]|uniref:hypothetical protein n=1 Tax=Nannocystis pusilla TaxID=889268 RepID=UPI003DA46D89
MLAVFVPRARHILSAARAATVWLLMVVSMFLGPVSAFAAGPDACGEACPCEEAEHDEDDCGDELLAEEHGTPPDEECPEGCPGCHSSPGVALPSFECSLPRSPPSSSTYGFVLSDARATGVCTGVFRPPRS